MNPQQNTQPQAGQANPLHTVIAGAIAVPIGWFLLFLLSLLFCGVLLKPKDILALLSDALVLSLVLTIVLVVIGLMLASHAGIHMGIMKKHERTLASLTVEQKMLKNAQLREQNKITEALPDLVRVAMDREVFNIEVTAKGDVRLAHYLSNLHAIQGQENLKALPQAAIPVRSFYELLTDGTVKNTLRAGKMLLGYTDSELRVGSWLDLYSCGIGGVTGSGKTTTVRFLLFQAVLAGASLIMIDPHIEDKEESLAHQFLCFTNVHLFKPCGDSPPAILQRIHYLKKELLTRKHKGIKAPFVILVIDEFNAVMRDKQVREEVASLLVSIAQEGRKFGLYAMLIGQRWSQQDIGGADIRTSLASMLAHRFTDENQASHLVGGRNAPKCLELPTGHFYFRDTNGTLSEMRTPLTVADDGPYIQHLLQIENKGLPVTDEHTAYTGIVENDVTQPENEQEEMEPLALTTNEDDMQKVIEAWKNGYTSIDKIAALFRWNRDGKARRLVTEARVKGLI